MKKILTSLVLLLVFQLSAQEAIGKKQWQQDLRFLQETINKDYSFLFKKVSAKKFNETADTFYKEIPTLEEHEIVVGFSKLIATIKYGHTLVSFHQKKYEFSQFPYNLYEFNDGIYIEGTHKNYSKAAGAKVIAIEGKPIADVLEAIKPTVEAENSQYFKAYGINNIRHPEVLHAQRITKSLQSRVTFTLEKNGQQFDQIFEVLANKEGVPRKYGFV